MGKLRNLCTTYEFWLTVQIHMRYGVWSGFFVDAYLALLTVVAELARLSGISLQNCCIIVKLAWGNQLDEVQEDNICRKKIWCNKKFWKTDGAVRKEIVGVLPGVLEVQAFSVGLLHDKRADTSDNKNSSCLLLVLLASKPVHKIYWKSLVQLNAGFKF